MLGRGPLGFLDEAFKPGQKDGLPFSPSPAPLSTPNRPGPKPAGSSPSLRLSRRVALSRLSGFLRTEITRHGALREAGRTRFPSVGTGRDLLDQVLELLQASILVGLCDGADHSKVWDHPARPQRAERVSGWLLGNRLPSVRFGMAEWGPCEGPGRWCFISTRGKGRIAS